MNNLPKLYLIIFLSACFLNGYAQTNVTLEQAIESTLTNNLQLKHSFIEEQTASEDLKQAKLNVLPVLNASANSTLNFGRSLDYTTYAYVTQKTLLAGENMTTNVVLFKGFQKINQISANKLVLEANQKGTQKLKNDLMLNVISTFLSILSAQDQLDAANQQLKVSTQQLDNAIKTYSAGKKMLTDISLARSQVANAELNITTIQNQLNNSLVNMIQFMALPPGTKINLVKPTNINEDQFVEKQTSDIYNFAVNNLPETKQTYLNKLYAQKEIEIAKGGYYPSLSLTGGIASNYSKNLDYKPFVPGITQPSYLSQFKANLYYYWGVNLTIPIFNNFSTKINVNKAKLNLQDALINEENVKNNIYKVITQANDDLNAASKTYNYSKEAYSAAMETYDSVEKRMAAGLSSSLDLNQALTQMNQAQFNLINAKYDLIFKSKIIDFYLGKQLAF